MGRGGRLQSEAGEGWQVSHTSEADKGALYTKEPPFSPASSSDWGALFMPAPLSFVHFVSGFNARGLNCCCGNQCLCFLPARCLLLCCDIIDHSATIAEVHGFPLVGDEQRRICSPCLSDQTRAPPVVSRLSALNSSRSLFGKLSLLCPQR